MINNEHSQTFRYISTAVWIGLSLLTAFAFAFFGSVPLWLSALVALALWCPYWLFSFFPVLLSRRFPITRQTFRRAVCVHLLGAVLFVVSTESLFFAFVVNLQPLMAANFEEGRGTSSIFDGRLPGEGMPPDEDEFSLHAGIVLFKGLSSFPLYWLLVAIFHSVSALTTLRLREKQSAELQAKLAHAELAQLRARLQPHFLFNTLNSIMVLMDESPAAAKGMIWDLSELLRIILRRSDTDRITLRHELELLNYYVSIQKIRFGSRLNYLQQVDDAILGTAVPPLLLQPLVENAIRHGIESTGKPINITLLVARQDIASIVLRLDNQTTGNHASGQNGEKTNKPAQEHSSGGIGLTNTRARLDAEFGEHYSFVAGWHGNNHYRVTLVLPFTDNIPAMSELPT